MREHERRRQAPCRASRAGPSPVSTTTWPGREPARRGCRPRPSSRDWTTLAGPRNASGASSATVRLSTAPSGASEPAQDHDRRVRGERRRPAAGSRSVVHRLTVADRLAEGQPGDRRWPQVEQRARAAAAAPSVPPAASNSVIWRVAVRLDAVSSGTCGASSSNSAVDVDVAAGLDRDRLQVLEAVHRAADGQDRGDRVAERRGASGCRGAGCPRRPARRCGARPRPRPPTSAGRGRAPGCCRAAPCRAPRRPGAWSSRCPCRRRRRGR